MPNERWDDFAIDREIRSVHRRIDGLEDAYKGIRELPMDVGRLAQAIEDLSPTLQDLRSHINRVSDKCDQIRDGQEAKTEMRILERGRGRIALSVAAIGALAILIAALVSLAGVLIGGHP